MRIDTPIGPLHIATKNGALIAARFEEPLDGPADPRVARAVEAYFAGDRRALDAIAVDPAGTPFQKAVWKLLREIPVGETRTYGELAKQLNSSPRAVGSANGRNPIALVIPCHRVIARGGALSGYAWGVHRKRWLLQHELTSSPASASTGSARSRSAPAA